MITCGFYDSIKADRRYYPHQLTDLFTMLVPNGIFSGIGNGFACKAKDLHTIIVKSGLLYFNGYYAYNDADLEYTIPEDVYPVPGLMGITIDTDPTQVDYPVGNRIDVDGIVVMGIKSNVSVADIRIEENPQTDYPYGNKIDLGHIKVLGDLVAVEESRVGDCYIVIEFDSSNRKFEIKAVNTNDYRSETQQVLAVCHKTSTLLTCESVVGRTINDIIVPTKWITGLFQSVLIDDIFDDIVFEEESFMESFKAEKNAYWDNWLNDNKYYLWHLDGGATQYSRLTDELATKENKPIVVYDTIQRGTTEISIYVADMPSNPKISYKLNPYGLIVNSIYVSGSYVRMTFEPASRNFSVSLTIR